MTKRTVLFCALFALLCARPLPAQEAKLPELRHITLDEAVQLALKHNHVRALPPTVFRRKSTPRTSRGVLIFRCFATTAMLLT
jgi:hypothetical protein